MDPTGIWLEGSEILMSSFLAVGNTIQTKLKVTQQVDEQGVEFFLKPRAQDVFSTSLHFLHEVSRVWC